MFDEPLDHCLLCDSGRIRPFAVDFQDRRIFRCRECDITFLNPQYSDEYLRKLYDRYPGIHFPGAGKNTPLGQRMRREIHDYYLSLVERYVRPGRLLAVGCGDGLEMSIARDRGWTVKGCDVDEKAISRVRSQGFEVFHGSLEGIPFPSTRYDCVYLHHVLEHPKNPQTYLRKASEILDTSGVLFIASPNLGSLSNRLKTFLSRARLNRRSMKHYDTWHHLFYYTPSTLKWLLETCFGYRVLLAHCGLDDRDHRWSLSNRIVRSIPGLTILKSKFILLCKPAAVPAGNRPVLQTTTRAVARPEPG